MTTSMRQNVPSNFADGGIGLIPGGASVPPTTAAQFGQAAIPAITPSPDLVTILWSILGRVAPVAATYAALAAFGAGPSPSNSQDRQDGQIVLVEQDNSIWRWAASSTLAASPTVFLAGDAPAAGRWVSVVAGSTGSAGGTIPVDLKGANLAAGTVVGAYSSPNVGYVAVGQKSLGLRWHSGTLTAIWTEVTIPADCDTNYPLVMNFLVSKTGTTATDVVSMTVAAYAQVATFPAAVLENASPNLGSISTALTSGQAALAAGTVTQLTAAVGPLPGAGASLPTALSISLVPSGTLATDDVILEGAFLSYVKKAASPRLDVDFRAATLAAGTPLAAWASTSGASSSPGITLDNSKAVCPKWNNNATQTAIWTHAEMPADLDVTKPVVVRALLSKSGATTGDATTLDVAIFLQVPGALEDATTGTLGLGGTTNALVGNLTALTVSEVSYTIAANTLTAAPCRMSISVKPTNGTLGTDNAQLNRLWIEYTPKPASIKVLPFDLKAGSTSAASTPWAATPMAAWASTSGASSSPGVTLENSKAHGVKWNNNATQVLVYSDAVLPPDFDVSQACTMVVDVTKTGATAADTAPFTINLYEQVPGSTDVGGPTFSGVTAAIATPTAAAKTVSRLTLTIPGGTFTVAPARVTLSVSPQSGKLSTDNALCCGCWVEYQPKSS
jgi:hypothetical protein